MITPTIHLNGTSGVDLLEQTQAAVDAISDAIKAVRAAAPHPRDYYTQGGDTFSKARDEHFANVEKLHAVRDELQQLVIEIWKQVDLRSARKRV